MAKSEGRQFHAQAAILREEGKYIESLSNNDQALIAYDNAGDTAGFAEGIACRSITLRHLAGLHDSWRFLTLAKYEMLASVEISRKDEDISAIVLPLFQLAQIQERLGEYSDAVLSYKEAVATMETNPPKRHNRPSVLADMKVHMATCEYQNGDKSALERALQALADLKAAKEPNTFNKNVWVSGAYMRLARIVKNDDPAKAREYLQEAKNSIDSDKRLVIRKEQWEQLSATFT